MRTCQLISISMDFGIYGGEGDLGIALLWIKWANIYHKSLKNKTDEKCLMHN